MKISDLKADCRHAVQTIDSTATPRTAIAQLENSGAQGLLVMHAGEPLGWFDYRRACRACLYDRMDEPLQKHTASGMIVAAESDDMLQIVERMVAADQSVVLITDDQHPPVSAKLGRLCKCLLHHMTEELESWQRYLTDLQAANID